MSISLQLSPSTSAQRGEATVQPAYFTSSAFVDALRDDLQTLVNIYSEKYNEHLNTPRQVNDIKPFSLFKEVWSGLGWQWLHLKILEPRARESFLSTVLRLFIECTGQHKNIMHRVVGLFGLYTFYMSQPSTATPRKLPTACGIPITHDTFQTFHEISSNLGEREEALKPIVKYILGVLQPVFYILPQTSLFSQYPRTLPRELVRDEVVLEEGVAHKKKAGRPSKSEKAHRMRAAVTGLERWLEKSSYPANNVHNTNDPAGAAGMWRGEERTEDMNLCMENEYSTHIMLSQRPMATLNSYRNKKSVVVQLLEDTGDSGALDRAGERIVRRLREIDAAAADQGLEVGTEGGDLSAIERVEAAVSERSSLAMLEGGGLHVIESLATSSGSMDEHEVTVRNRIIESVFAKRNAAGDGPQESYAGHLKIWESEGGNDKPRYVILSRTSNSSPLIHKSRVNPNGTFSVGKTWKLADLRGIQVPNQLEINIAFARSYIWQTESQQDQNRFLTLLVNLFRESFGPDIPLRISGFSPDPPPSRSVPERGYVEERPTNSGVTATDPRQSTRSQGVSIYQRPETSTPPTVYRSSPLSNGRPMSSASTSRTQSPGRGVTTRSSSPAMSASGTSSGRRTRRPSTAASVSSRTNDPVPSNKYPSIVIPPTPGLATRPKETSPLRSKPIQIPQQSHAQPQPNSTSYTPFENNSFPTPSSINGASTLSIAASTSSNVYSSGPRSPSDHVPSSSVETSQIRYDSTIRIPSPAPSSRRSERSIEPNSEPNGSRVITKMGVPIVATTSQQLTNKRDPNARISFFDPTNQSLLDRLLFATEDISNGVDGHDGDGDDEGEWLAEGDTAAATLSNIEEMLEGYEWIGEGLPSRSKKGPADAIESRLLDELVLLERANIHSLLESDDERIAKVIKGLEEAITELDNMEKTVNSYKIHLNAASDDIVFIQSQNRGLQVQIQNQQLLLNELEKLLQTVHVERESLVSLTQESLEKDDGIARLEAAVTELYKALLAGRDNDMAATMERLEEYRSYNSQFCKRVLDFLTIMFNAQSNLLLGDTNGVEKGSLSILAHQPIEAYLGRYCGLMLYMKEMDEAKYSKICAAYFSAASDLHAKQVKALLTSYSKFIRQASEEESEQAFASTEKEGLVSGGLRRAGTVVRNPLDAKKDRVKKAGGKLKPSEVLDSVFEQLAPQIYRERAFISDFLLINDTAITFADYIGLDHYFRRQASQYAGLSNATAKLVRTAMDLIFGFLPTELKAFIDAALAKDNIQIVGVMAAVERGILDADERGNGFFASILERQQQRLRGIFDRHVDEQIKGVEQTRLDTKKRRGVAHFIKYFPIYVSRVENQLIGAEKLEIRKNVDSAYDRIVQSMFDSLKQTAKLDGEGEDKGQLNYHVILIENMYYFISEIGQLDIAATDSFRKRADVIYEENLTGYVKLLMRRSFSKIIDYFEGVERMLKTTAPTEVSKSSSYSRSALKRVVKDYDSKDVRKNVDALFKRVEKHFTDSDAPEGTNATSKAIAEVWKACEDELLRMTNFFLKNIALCYKESGVSLEYSTADVEAAFKRHRIGT